MNINFDYKNLSPFKWFVLENFPFIEADFDALTEWQLFCKIGKEINKIIDSQNIVGEQAENLTNAFNNLKNYVDNYFNNLDVQDEINNKLNEMAEDGTLAEIINQEIFGNINNRLDTIENTTIGDLNNLTTLKKDSIVNAININNWLQQIYLGRGITYDINEDLGHVQGSCIHENNLYVAVQGVNNYGTIFIFNIVSNTYVGKYENVLMYHANDLTYVNDKIYIASYDSLKICIYDITTNITTEIDPFAPLSNTYSHILSVEKIDDDNILCWIENSNTYTLKTDKFLKLNLTTLDYTEYLINDEYNITTFSGSILTRQNLCLDNNNLYLLLALPNIIFQANIIDNTINFTKIYNLPVRDITENPVGELESLAIINNSVYPTGSIMITGRTFETFKNTNNVYTKDTINTYIFSPKTGNVNFPILASGQYPVRPINCSGYYSVSKSAGNLVEDGTFGRPFKNLMRGINSVMFSKNSPAILQITDSSDYYIPFLYGINGIEIQINNNCHPTIYFGDIEECDITFLTLGNGTLKIKPINTTNYRTSIFNSKIRFYGEGANSIIFEEIQIFITKCSDVKMRRCTWSNTNHMSSGYAIQISDSSYAIFNIANYSINSSDKLIQISSLANVCTNISRDDIVLNGDVFLITPTT